MKRIIAIMLIGMSLTACSTVAGIGKDIQDTANWTKDKMGGK
jgi:predicted small secreted protein